MFMRPLNKLYILSFFPTQKKSIIAYIDWLNLIEPIIFINEQWNANVRNIDRKGIYNKINIIIHMEYVMETYVN